MSRESFRRNIVSRREPDELRTNPPPELPEKLVRAFPEMGPWWEELRESQAKLSERVRLALAETREPDTDFVAIFEEELG